MYGRALRARAHLEPLPRALRAPSGRGLLNEFAARARRLGVGRRAAAGGAAVVAAAARARRAAPSSARCSPRATTRCCLRAGDRVAQPGPPQVQRRRLQRDPRPRRRIAEHRDAAAGAAAGAAHDARRAPRGRLWVVNLHASTRGAAGSAQARAERAQAAGTALGWAGGAPLVLGGDFNLARHARAARAARTSPATTSTTSTCAGSSRAGRAEVLDRGTLSDHPPVRRLAVA